MEGKFYKLKGATGSWGDYSSILIQGMGSHENGILQLSRTGPFVPPISFPDFSIFVVTAAFRAELEKSELTGFQFNSLIKKHITRVDWTTWDQTTDNPEWWPEDGEPEGYVLDLPHSQETADEIGELFEVVFQHKVQARRVKTSDPFFDDIYLRRSTWNGTDFFGDDETLRTYVSERAKKWLESQVGQWVEFEEALTE